MNRVSRRDFLRNLAVLGLAAAGAGGTVLGASCGAGPSAPASVKPSSAPAASVAEPARPPVEPSAAPPTSVRSAATGPTPAPPGPTPAPTPGRPYLVVARGESPAAMVQAALKALGGMERFVKPGADVIVKPNICVAYHTFEYAATTNPEVVASLVSLCLGAGAKRVRVMDFPFGGTAEQAYARSGIAEAVKAAGGQMELMSNLKFQDTPIPGGRELKRWKVYRDALEADLLINVPIAKTHNLGRLTLGMKNMMGLIQDRGQIHSNLGRRVADITGLIRPSLTVVDAVRMLMKNGPTGGSLNDVKLANTIVASHDVVAADAYATGLFGLKATDLVTTVAGAEAGLGTLDLSNVRLEEIGV